MLKRIAVTINAAGTGTLVDLPSYSEVVDTWAPVTPDVIDAHGWLLPVKDGKTDTSKEAIAAQLGRVIALEASIVVDIPDSTPLDSAGQIDAPRFRAMYAGSRFGSDDYVPPVLQAP